MEKIKSFCIDFKDINCNIPITQAIELEQNKSSKTLISSNSTSSVLEVIGSPLKKSVSLNTSQRIRGNSVSEAQNPRASMSSETLAGNIIC